ncbi:uracil-DNA glycosylase [Wenzhouxiangella sediminis]|uniref:Uracil-DNA glycosylase n=1 Tax=Wenzhouxiangella sediminis TaxID=1792836 RepID=A0A3E1KAE2_9GAMM|nr:uracil-DNA glycosylase [Wenzhouxiangella sediminis]RFF31289.1 uracil-DNA glycosylase [Wenzhouxiangella sediminis]
MQEQRDIQLQSEWLEAIGGEFEKDYMRRLKRFLVERKQAGATIYPPGPQIFNALDSTPLSKVKAVILGQDPYHGPGQAHGLCFSVQRGVRPPPSLVNIFKEIESDLGYSPPAHGCLQAWADRGVLLLNAVLTVEKGNAGSHQGKGWEQFTDAAVRAVNEQRDNVVFLLWGSHAQKKGAGIDRRRHLVLKAPHPSPLSAHRGFLGCRHFSKANEWLASRGVTPIDWSL